MREEDSSPVLQFSDEGSQHSSNLVASIQQSFRFQEIEETHPLREDQMGFELLQRPLRIPEELNERPRAFAPMAFGDIRRNGRG